MADRYKHSNAELKRVQKIQFGLLSPKFIRDMSVCEVDKPEFQGKEGSLGDLRLGASRRGELCKSCGCDHTDCPGHFGHLELATEVFHEGLMSFIRHVLGCVCHNCGRLMVEESDPRFQVIKKMETGTPKLRALSKLCQTIVTCGGKKDKEIPVEGMGISDKLKQGAGCGTKQPKIRSDGYFLRIEHRSNADEPEQSQDLSPKKVAEVFSRISDDTCRLMGLNPQFGRPEWAIIQALPIPPPPVRPVVEGQVTSKDHLTHQLEEIIKINNSLKTCKDSGGLTHIHQDEMRRLQLNVAGYMDNSRGEAKLRKGLPIKSITQRLKGKEGRVRGNLMGKRVDFSARTVITADPILAIDQVGVPRSIARILTVPEIVTQYNITKLKKLIENGPDEHPGALYIVKPDGTRQDLRYAKKLSDLHLEYGYRVERHIDDGDVVLFNRQPSLHKMSIMAHKIKVMPYSTFRLNLCVTPPYNADFDGDEMNLHVPQTLETQAEALELMCVPKQIITPQSNKPVIGLVQDTLLGSMLFTRRDTFFTRDEVMNILMWLDGFGGKLPQPVILAPKELWTGKQIFSMILPPGINLSRTSSTHNDKESGLTSEADTKVVVIDGNLISGILDGDSLKTKMGGLVHVLVLELGHEAAKLFLGRAQHVVNFWLQTRGFSIGIGDAIADATTMEEIQRSIETAKRDCREHIQNAQNGKLKRKPGRTIMESFEHDVNQSLNKARDDAGSHAQKNLKSNNNMKAMCDAGSKGSTINISQVIACVGQQNVMGKRIPYGFRGRTLPHFVKDDYGPESRGFVENSYLRGLTPQEFFFHAMGGREGLIDTAVKTAETGYIQRRLVKAMEDVMLKYDGTVRNSRGHIVQFLYGEDGLDGCWIEAQNLEILTISDMQFEREFQWSEEEIRSQDFGRDFLDHELIEEMRSPTVLLTLRQEYEQLAGDRDRLRKGTSNPLQKNYLPVNIKRLITNSQKKFRLNLKTKSNLNPIYVIEGVKQLCETISVIRGQDAISIEAANNATMHLKALLRSNLSAKQLIQKLRFTKEAFDWIRGEIASRFVQSIAHPGEMVGPLAAQSMGEPATQMTLNTFHFAGVSAKNVTLGVPRLNELINVATKNKTPSMVISLGDSYKRTQDEAKKIQSQLEHATLRTVTLATEIFFDPDPRTTIIAEDLELVQMFEIDDRPDAINASPWVLRIEFDKKVMVDKNLEPSDVAEQIQRQYTSDYSCVYSDANAEKLILRIRILKGAQEENSAANENEDDQDPVDFLKRVESRMFSEVTLRGIPEITKVSVGEGKETVLQADGKYKSISIFQLVTDGTALIDVLPRDGIDFKKTFSNSIVEVYQVLGIEAARNSLLNELRAVLEFYGLYVNYRHLSVLVDVMTTNGHLMAITRHGINRQDSGPLRKCSFEETADILLEAAFFSELDNMTGIAENVMLGQMCRLGTGCFELLLDQAMLKYAVDTRQGMEDFIDGNASPGQTSSPHVASSLVSPHVAEWSPYAASPSSSDMSPSSPEYNSGMVSPSYSVIASPAYHMHSPSSHMPASPAYEPASPMYEPSSPYFEPSSPASSPSYRSPSSPAYSPSSPTYSPASPAYSPASPAYSPSSPAYSPSSPAYSPSSPAYSPSSPAYSPSSPAYSPSSPAYSPSSPAYSPSSPAYSPSSPAYSPSSPAYSPSSPAYSPSSPAYSPSSPAYSPSSPAYSPSSPAYSPSSPAYSPSSPAYSPSSPAYSPSSPAYSPSSPAYSPSSPAYSPSSPAYSPSSPAYSPSSPAYSSSPAAHSGASPGVSEASPQESPQLSLSSPVTRSPVHPTQSPSP
eukprot:c12937_g1_i1.p1 GENE.c12937_g1_i1~~c12937_g1_i1.p1  ORF type:complete len:1809 (-),score=303.34 c12937_g1_i1:220-5646(-)